MKISKKELTKLVEEQIMLVQESYADEDISVAAENCEEHIKILTGSILDKYGQFDEDALAEVENPKKLIKQLNVLSVALRDIISIFK